MCGWLVIYNYTLGICFGGNGLLIVFIPYFCLWKGDLRIMEWHGVKNFNSGFNGRTNLVHSMCGQSVMCNYTHNYILLHTWYLLRWQWLVKKVHL